MKTEYLSRIGIRYRLLISFCILVIWMSIVAVGVNLTAGPGISVVKFVSGGLAWPIVFAVLFLAIVLACFGWRDVGFNRFSMTTAIRLMWLPLVYLAVYAAVIAALGVPPFSALLFIIINTILVGISEELMFRGILFNGLRSRLSLWQSIWIGSLLFGAVHVLNAVQTGNWTAAALQAVAAFQTGMILMALRIRIGSLYPVMALHAVWDCLPLIIVTHAGDLTLDQPLPAYAYFAPLLVLPNFLYALYLLRPKGLAKDLSNGQ